MKMSEMLELANEHYETHALIGEEPDWELEPDPEDDDDEIEEPSLKGDIQRRLDLGIALAEPDKSRE